MSGLSPHSPQTRYGPDCNACIDWWILVYAITALYMESSFSVVYFIIAATSVLYIYTIIYVYICMCKSYSTIMCTILCCILCSTQNLRILNVYKDIIYHQNPYFQLNKHFSVELVGWTILSLFLTTSSSFFPRFSTLQRTYPVRTGTLGSCKIEKIRPLFNYRICRLSFHFIVSTFRFLSQLMLLKCFVFPRESARDTERVWAWASIWLK